MNICCMRCMRRLAGDGLEGVGVEADDHAQRQFSGELRPPQRLRRARQQGRHKDAGEVVEERGGGGVYSISCMAVVVCMTIDPRIPTPYV